MSDYKASTFCFTLKRCEWECNLENLLQMSLALGVYLLCAMGPVTRNRYVGPISRLLHIHEC